MNICEIYKPLRGSTIDVSLDFLPRHCEVMDLEPDFQRDHVWSPNDSSKFVGFVLEGGEGSPIIVNNIDYEEKGFGVVVDGKQRILSLLGWLNGSIPAILSSGKRVYRSDIDGSLMRVGVKIRRAELTRREMLEYYVKVNSSGVVHSHEEIERVKRLIELEG